jgi:protocatechuate 3,4-dioxygenase beta subunit
VRILLSVTVIMSIKIFLLIVLLFPSLNSQEKDESKFRLVGGPCEGCEAILEYGNKILSPIDTLPDFNDEGQKIKITGTIYQTDGTTPAKDVILYIYHTDQNGKYVTKGDETGWAKRHGYIRGWIKTDPDGKYIFYTLKPGVYPTRTAPAHIHPVILEPDGKYYWIEEFLFDGDPLLSDNDANKNLPRGGDNYVLTLKENDNLFIGERDIILGKNVPGYND